MILNWKQEKFGVLVSLLDCVAFRNAALLALLLLPGCSGPLFVTLFNNTSKSIEVVDFDTVIEVHPQHQATFRIAHGVHLRINGQNVQYSHFKVPGRYYRLHKIFRHRIVMQLEEGGSLLLLLPSTELPASPDTAQPKGFPLVPMAEQSNKLMQTEL